MASQRPRVGRVEDLVPGTAVRLQQYGPEPFQVVDRVIEVPQAGPKQGFLKVVFWGEDRFTNWLEPGTLFEVRVEGPDCNPKVEYGPYPDPDPMGWNSLPDWEPSEVAEMLWDLYLAACVCNMDHGSHCTCSVGDMVASRLEGLLGSDWHSRMNGWVHG